MPKRLSQTALWVLVGLLMGCGSTTKVKNAYRQSVGSASRADVVAKTTEILQTRYAYRFERQVDSNEDIRLETQWRDLTPTEDERALGITAARSRIMVTARPRNRTSGLGNTYSVTFLGEVEARTMENTLWLPIALTDERKEYYREIYKYLETELRTGLRTY